MDRSIDLSGIDDHTVRNLPLVTAGGVVRSNRGDIILVMNQYAHMADGKTSYTLQWTIEIVQFGSARQDQESHGSHAVHQDLGRIRNTTRSQERTRLHANEGTGQR